MGTGCRGAEVTSEDLLRNNSDHVLTAYRIRQWAKAEKFVMIGASHGGMLTLEYALAYPQHLYGILVGDTTAQFSHWCIANSMKEALRDPRVSPDPEQVLRILTGRSRDQEDLITALTSLGPLYEVPAHVGHQPEVNVGEVMAKSIKPFFETHNAAYCNELSRYDLRDRLVQIMVPAFVWVGRYDWITPIQAGEEVARGLGNLKKFVVYEKSGHLPALEERTKFQKDVREFLNELKF